jgi:predicted PurR-regulated permease PerM
MTGTETNFSKRAIETGLAFLLLLVLLYALYNTLSIFLGVFTFAIIFSVSFYQLFESLSGRLGGRRKLTAFLYGLVLVGLVALPCLFGISMLGDALRATQHFVANMRHGEIPPLPAFITELPFVGEKAAGFWNNLKADPQAVLITYQPRILAFLHHLLSAGAGLAGAGLELILGIVISAIFLYKGKVVLLPLQFILSSLAGESRSHVLIDASGKAIKGVSIGVMGTGLIAGMAAWIGYSIAGLSVAGVLAVLTFFLVVIQVGPALLLIPVLAWLVSQGQSGNAIFLGIYGLIVLVGIDNVLKPILIGKSVKMPILVLFLGVVGGMAAWGFTGMFKGAIILAVAYTLFQSLYSDKIPKEAIAQNGDSS